MKKDKAAKSTKSKVIVIKKDSKKIISAPVPKLDIGIEKNVKTGTKKTFQKEIFKKLTKDRALLLSEVAEQIKHETRTSFEMGDIYDIASTERERELTLMLGDRGREKLSEINEALERLEDGSYGLCIECGEPIGEGRLKAMPFAKACIDCKYKDEKEKGARKRYDEEHGLGIVEKIETDEEEF